MLIMRWIAKIRAALSNQCYGNNHRGWHKKFGDEELQVTVKVDGVECQGF